MRSGWKIGFSLIGAAAVVVAGAVALVNWGRQNSRPSGLGEAITFYQDVAPIVWKHCAACHRKGEAGPFELITYEQVKKHASQMVKVTTSRFMPPWLPEKGYGEFADERRLSEAEINLIAQWVKGGCMEGKATGVQPPQWVEGWQLGKPDLIAQMPVSYVLPADGKDVYRNFVIPVESKQPRWVRAVEFRMGTTVVHHAFVLVDRSGTARRRDSQDAEAGYEGMDAGEDVSMPEGHLLSWQPGRAPSPGSSERGWRLNRGTDIVLQMHLQPNGKSSEVRSSIGLYFSDKPPSQLSHILVIRPPVIDIPAGEKNYVVESSYTLPLDLDVVSVLPHAHYLGKELAGSATLPDGSVKPLILIKNWDFNWQSDYRYKEPLKLPKGTKVSMRFSFDNSEQNVHNPNRPPRTVRYGPNSTDEMAELWLQVVPKNRDELRELARDYATSYWIADAIARCRGVLKYAPDNAEWRAKLGAVLAKVGKVDEGIAEIRRALELEPGNVKTHYMLAVILGGTGNVAAAMDEYERVLALDPENFRAHNNLGMIYLEQGKIDPAARHFYNAVRINPNDLLANTNLAQLFLVQRNWGQARLQIKTVLEIDPQNERAKAALKQVEEALGEQK
jgi:tetratricopeptide (TPR) repeat protein